MIFRNPNSFRLCDLRFNIKTTLITVVFPMNGLALIAQPHAPTVLKTIITVNEGTNLAVTVSPESNFLTLTYFPCCPRDANIY
jgi:hypothetical protein